MSFVLSAVTRGDDLIPSARTLIAESADKALLETLRAERLCERNSWLAKNSVSWWEDGSVISDEVVEEVPSLP